MKVIITSGKRKRAIARATAYPGTGKVRINNNLLEHLTPALSQLKIMEPLMLAKDVASKLNIDVNVTGGGYNSQAEAVRLAIARALVENNSKLKETFLEYDRQLLVADVRRKETHKPNSHGRARAKTQKSYR
ncbi:MAG: 30S ribosomal protein S9 [archaeon]